MHDVIMYIYYLALVAVLMILILIALILIHVLTRNSSLMKNLALVTSESSPSTCAENKNQNVSSSSELKTATMYSTTTIET